jgi:hypothetical protein
MEEIIMFRLVLMNALKLGLAFMCGLLISGFIFLGLGLVADAFGQDAVPVYEAKPGEIDRSFNYKAEHQGVVQDEVIYLEVTDASDAIACDRTNRRTYQHVKYIAAIIAGDPSRGESYAGLLVLLHTQWCTDYD